MEVLNRLGYLEAQLPGAEQKSSVRLVSPVVVEWRVAPTDALVQKIGVRYVAFDVDDGAVPVRFADRMKLMSPQPVDGFWLYRLR